MYLSARMLENKSFFCLFVFFFAKWSGTKKELYPSSIAFVFPKWSLSQNPLFVKGLFSLIISMCLFLLVHFLFLKMKYCYMFILFFLLHLCKVKTKQKRRTHRLDRERKSSRPNCNSWQDVMLGWNPSRPALEWCLDCLPPSSSSFLNSRLFLFVLSTSGMLSLE